MTMILIMTLVHQKMTKMTLRLPSQVPPKSTRGRERLLSLTPDSQQRQNATTIHQNILARPPPPDQSNYRLQREQFYIPQDIEDSLFRLFLLASSTLVWRLSFGGCPRSPPGFIRAWVTEQTTFGKGGGFIDTRLGLIGASLTSFVSLFLLL
jgi:hypothetical protein